jgi:hypothetical protein
MTLTTPGKILISTMIAAVLGGIIYSQESLYHEVKLLQQEAKVKIVKTRIVIPSTTPTATISASIAPTKAILKGISITKNTVIPIK